MILFDDYRGDTPLGAMLRITHEFCEKVNVKTKSTEINPACVIFTSNEPYSLWQGWKGQSKEPFQRRITDEYYLTWSKPSGNGITEEDLRSIRSMGRQAWAHIVKGRWPADLHDPPESGFDEEINDVEVEEAIQRNHEGNWLPKKRRVTTESGLTESEGNALVQALQGMRPDGQ